MRAWSLPAAAAVLTSCAPVVNLLNPATPRFEGDYAAPAARESARPPGAVRVVSFNIKLSDRITRAIDVLRSDPLRGADVISLQEMDEAGVEQIARELGLNYIYYPASIHPTRRRYFGPAILTRWPIRETRKLILPHEGLIRNQRRSATAATLDVAGACMRVYAVHLETQFRASDYAREDQVDAILEDAAGSTCPVVVAGDFNSWEIGKYLERNGYAWPTKRVGNTISFFSWDHIFVRGLSLPDTGAAGKVNEVNGASDHSPVWATVLLRGRQVSSSRAP